MRTLRALIRRQLANRSGAAAAELAMLLPLMILLLFGGFEGGHFIWTQHKLVEAVRNGARYAGRLEVTEVCDGATSIIPPARIAEIKLLTRTGQLDDSAMHPLVPGWGDDAVFVSVDCNAFVDTGIYRELDAAGPVATVAARGVPYPSLFGGLGIFDPGIRMNARASAPVIGL
ncbi:TadE/TadG family type IV pilus assembly protein [Novosphingobium arvoryzae]|uniref:TadE/TadG family type IV pilus assembly protein n=1 Tax=Novosphingobium arvoryzae TaxID=1256514 RepID=UPI001675861A|nr:TadE/TadG family type IV pilus assembly protein [Novosphingobium arvoryzae]